MVHALDSQRKAKRSGWEHKRDQSPPPGPTRKATGSTWRRNPALFAWVSIWLLLHAWQPVYWLASGLDDRGIIARFTAEARDLFSTMCRPALGMMQPPIQRVLGALSPGIKWPGCEVDHTLPPGAKLKTAWTQHIHRNLSGKSDGKRSLGRPAGRWMNVLKWVLRKQVWGYGLDLSGSSNVQMRDFVNTVMDFRFYKRWGIG